MKFMWGAATSSHQVEGGNRHNDWWDWESKGNIEGGVRSGRATDHWHLFREDLQLAKDLGLNSYRFSFEWSRFETERGEWNRDAVAWYSNLIAECERLGITPMATLHHFTLPQWLAKEGGFSNEASPDLFANYAKKIAKEFAHRIPIWCTINEPLVLVSGAYLGKFMPPGEFEPKKASRACFNLLKAHVLAYDILKKEKESLEVGFAHNMLHFMPERKYHPIEVMLAQGFSSFYNDAWLKAVSGEKQGFGFPGFIPQAPQLEIARNRKTYDFIGLNYYTKAYVQWRPRTQSKERHAILPIGVSFARRKEISSDLSWAIHPQGFKAMLLKLKKYGAPVYITENGIADAQDRLRASYLQSHLSVLAEVIEDGLDVRGYYHWSLIDNFEWIKGYGPRFGLCAVDYDTYKREPRPSASFYRDIVLAHGADRPPERLTLQKFQLP